MGRGANSTAIKLLLNGNGKNFKKRIDNDKEFKIADRNKIVKPKDFKENILRSDLLYTSKETKKKKMSRDMKKESVKYLIKLKKNDNISSEYIHGGNDFIVALYINLKRIG